MAYKLQSGMLVRCQIAYVDSAGNPAQIDGEVTWTSSNDTIATVAADSGDSTLAVISSVGLGSCQVNATSDADLGAGTRPLVTLLDVDVVAAEAVAGTISIVGEPEPIAPHAQPH